MNVQAEVSLYPLRQPHLAKPIHQFIESLGQDNLHVKTGMMSSVIEGDLQVVLGSIQRAFEQVAERCEMVLTIKVSNACKRFDKS